MRSLLLAIGFNVLAVTMASAAPPTVQGRWLTASGNLEIVVAPCGPALCGKVARVLANHSMSAMNQESSAPPARAGLTILSDLRPTGEGRWRGKLFNRENGRTYDCNVRLLANGALEVRGYVVLPLIGQTQVWRRP